MTVKNIVKMGHPALKNIAEPVTDPTSPEIKSLLNDMRDSLVAVNGNGLAAPQIEVNRRVVVYRVPEHIIPTGAQQTPVPWTYMLNPVLEPLSENKEMIWERCLSLPGLYGKVPRYTNIILRYVAPDGKAQERKAIGFHAMLLQHECDHLDGILYPMRMTDMSYLTFASELGDGGAFYNYHPSEFD